MRIISQGMADAQSTGTRTRTNRIPGVGRGGTRESAGRPRGPAGSPRAPRTVWRGIGHAVLVFCVSRIVTVVVAHAITAVSGWNSVVSVLASWDGNWYLEIVRSGYPTTVPAGSGPEATSAIAFFPGYPLAIRAVSAGLGLSPAWAGVTISVLAGAAAVAAIWVLTHHLADARTANWTVVLVSFFPASFVLSMVYADALFLLCAALCLLALLRGHWVAAGLAAAVAGTVRPNGLVLTLCCVWAAAVVLRRDRSWKALAAPALAPLGAVGYLSFVWWRTGDPFAYFRVQEQGWDMRFDLGLANLRDFVSTVATDGFTFHLAMVVVVAISATAALYLLVKWRPPGVVLVYAAGILVLALLSSNTVSILRFALHAFPILIPVAARLTDSTAAVAAAVSGTLMATIFILTGLMVLTP